MKEIANQGAQGDVMFRRVASIPPNARAAIADGGRYVVAHSETGHHHTVDANDGVNWFLTDDPMVSYLKVKTHADVVHRRDWDTHDTLRLLGQAQPIGDPVIWEVRRQREWRPEGWATVLD